MNGWGDAIWGMEVSERLSEEVRYKLDFMIRCGREGPPVNIQGIALHTKRTARKTGLRLMRT